MKYAVLFIFSVCVFRVGHTQNKSFTSFRDYLVPASRLDSLRKVEQSISPNSQSRQYLHLLIAIELGKSHQDDSITAQQYNKIVQLATRHKSILGLAMANYLMGLYNSSWQEEVAYEQMMKAQSLFTQLKDTSGIVQCLGWSLRQFTQDDPSYGSLGKKDLLKMNQENFAKLVALSKKSRHAIDRFTYYRIVLNIRPPFFQEITETQQMEAFRAASEILDKNPHLAYLRKALYRAAQQGYLNSKKFDKLLELGLKILNHPEIKATYPDYRNVANTYTHIKKYDSVIVYMEEAIRRAKIEDPKNLRALRGMNRRLKNAYFEVRKWEKGIKAYDEYDKYNNLVRDNDRRLAVYEIKEKYSFTEKEAELKRISLEKQVAESRNQLLKAQYEAEKREAALKNLALENQATESKTKLLQSKIEVQKKESAIRLAESQKQLLVGGLLVALGLIGTILVFSIKLRKTNTKLLELQQGRDKFYTIIAHDLRTPINSLNDMGVVLQHLIQEGKKQELDKVIQQIENMRQKTQLLLNNLFEWGKSQYFTPEVEEAGQPTDVVPLLRELYQTYLPFAEAKKIVMVAELPSRSALSVAPGGLLMTVRNLLDNALKNTPAGGNIKIEMSGSSSADSPSQSFSKLTITDTGKGIAPDQLYYLQQVFAGKLKPEVGVHGLGLGMVLSHHFVQKNKAELTVQSELGKGTCFQLTLKT
ncbi:tetratricopeptide repeat-containing sensor histidine kinase [Runella zeae]|uniref:tetratricopeptide repeat-containing sensor histidine kinase n=1 Tax=Runella zeae TaxID=94255 RepID=UPI002352A41F|nr:HAMP domain-containing sensor histidine kinase [Runella zeae]